MCSGYVFCSGFDCIVILKFCLYCVLSCCVHMYYYVSKVIVIVIFLNQARAWFLKITSVRMYVCVCVCVCLCVCVSAPEAMNN